MAVWNNTQLHSRSLPYRKRHKDMIHTKGIVCRFMRSVRIYIIALHDTKIKHEGQGIAGRSRGRIQVINKAIIPQPGTNTAHRPVQRGSRTYQIPHSKHGVGCKCAQCFHNLRL
jgi:hypothetical protein